MIKIKLRRFDTVVELQLPTEWFIVRVNLWQLGLDRDPAKYTLEDLDAVFSYDTSWEHQMIRLIDVRYTLEDAITILQQMLAPPYPIAARLRACILSGEVSSGKKYVEKLDTLVQSACVSSEALYFSLSGEIPNARRKMTMAPQQILWKYGQVISEKLADLPRLNMISETYLFSDVEGFYQKLLSAKWSAVQIEGQLVGKIEFMFAAETTLEERELAAEKVEMIHSEMFEKLLKTWSVLTDRGELTIYLCDEEGDYEIISWDTLDENGEAPADQSGEEDELGDEVCLCPWCRMHLTGPLGMMIMCMPEDTDD